MEVDPSKEASEEMTDLAASSHNANPAVVVSPEEERKRKTADENDTCTNEKNDDGTESQGKKTRHGQDNADQEEANDEDDNNDNHDTNHLDSDADDEDGDESDTEPKSQENAQRPRPPPMRPIKRARTAYFIFTDEKRPLVQAEVSGTHTMPAIKK